MSAEPKGYLSEAFVSWQGEGAFAGARHLFVRTAGCNIRCRYCDTPESLTRTESFTADFPDGRRVTMANPVTVDAIADIVDEFLQRDPRISMISITGGEPMLQAAFLEAWLTRRPPAAARMLETNALILAGLDRVLPLMDAVSADLKLPTPTADGVYWQAQERFLGACADARERDGLRVYCKAPVDAATPVDEFERGLEMVERVLPGAEVFVQPVTAVADGSWQLTQARLVELARCGGGRVRIRPQLHKLARIR